MDTFDEGYVGITVEMLDRIRWQASVYPVTPNTEGISTIDSMYYVHAPELRRIPALKRSCHEWT